MMVVYTQTVNSSINLFPIFLSLSRIIIFGHKRLYEKLMIMPEENYYELANLNSIGISLPELLEYYRTICEQ